MNHTALTRPRAGRRARALLAVLVTAVIFFFLGRSILEGWASVRGQPWRIDPFRLLLSLGVLAVYYPLLVWNWSYLMGLLGQPVSLRTALPIWLGSQLGKFLPGKVWTVLGRVYLGERAGLDSRRVSLTLLIEVGMILVTGVFLAAGAVALGSDLPIPGRRFLFLLIVPGLVALHPRVFSFLVNVGLRILRRPPLTTFWPARSHALLVGSFLLSWVLYGTAFYLFLTSLSVASTNPLLHSWNGFLSVLCLHTVSWIVGFLAFLTPGGLGFREASLAFFLGSFLSAAAAALAAILARLWITLAELLAIAVAWLVGKRKGTRR